MSLCSVVVCMRKWLFNFHNNVFGNIDFYDDFRMEGSLYLKIVNEIKGCKGGGHLYTLKRLFLLCG